MSYVAILKGPTVCGLLFKTKTKSTRRYAMLYVQPRNSGMGLRLDHFLWVAEIISRHINLKDHAFVEDAKRIDNVYGGCPHSMDYKSERRYGGGGEGDKAFSRHRKWLNFWNEEMLAWAKSERCSPELLHKHLRKCLVYCGLSCRASSRNPAHDLQTGCSSPLIGLVLAALRVYYPYTYTVKSYSFQVIRTVCVEDILWLG